MDIEFDPAKDAENIAKHGVSLSRAVDLDVITVVLERRFRAYGYLDGKGYCLAFTRRGTNIRAINLRRAREKEMRRHTA
jgi:hypothetical protein